MDSIPEHDRGIGSGEGAVSWHLLSAQEVSEGVQPAREDPPHFEKIKPTCCRPSWCQPQPPRRSHPSAPRPSQCSRSCSRCYVSSCCRRRCCCRRRRCSFARLPQRRVDEMRAPPPLRPSPTTPAAHLCRPLRRAASSSSTRRRRHTMACTEARHPCCRRGKREAWVRFGALLLGTPNDFFELAESTRFIAIMVPSFPQRKLESFTVLFGFRGWDGVRDDAG